MPPSMKDPSAWRPTKFVMTKRGLRASADPEHIGPGSRFIGDITARAYANALERFARGSLLDVGCGLAPLYGTYAPLVSSSTHVDWATTGPTAAVVDDQVDLNAGLPYADATFDTVLATDVLEHIERPDVLWAHMSRVLRPGGHIILGVPFLTWIHEAPNDHHRFTEYKLRSLCADTGLDVVELFPYGGAIEVMADIVAKHLSPSRSLSAAFYRVCRVVVDSPPSHALSNRTKHRFPQGYVLIARKGGE